MEEQLSLLLNVKYKYYLLIDVVEFVSTTQVWTDEQVGRYMRKAMRQAALDQPKTDSTFIRYKILYEKPLRRWISPAERKMIYSNSDYTCSYCGKRGGTLHVDHVIPISRGGIDDIENMTSACPRCNWSKGSKLLSEWSGYHG